MFTTNSYLLYVLALITPCMCNSSVYMTKKAAAHKEDISIGYVPLTESIKSSTETIALLKRYADDSSIDCIVIHINSPGGNPGDSQVIADFILWIREIKPVIAFISNSGTSGAYWIAAACTEIIAAETAIIGSIGVVLELPKKNPYISFTAGKFKRPTYLGKGIISSEDTQEIQERIELIFDIFCKSIATLRGIPVEKVRNLEARVFLAYQALDHNLIDSVGTIQHVLERAADLVSYKYLNAPSTIRVVISPTEIFEFML